jgi:lipoyl(octanoyl) transferase
LSYYVEYKDIGQRDYKETWDYQADIFNKLVENKKHNNRSADSVLIKDPGTLIFVEHPHVYTLGKSGSENNLLADNIQLRAREAAFYRIDRGGDITYHGPGQIVGYPIFDLEAVGIGLKEYISRLEEVIIKTLAHYGIEASRYPGATGVWLDSQTENRARKICAIGVKASRYVTMHGFAFNVNTDLTYFDYINPCGFTDKGVTSLKKELSGPQDIEVVKNIVKGYFREVFDLEWTNK